jgi:hypothetical protein
MVQVTVTASVKVAGGPALTLSTTLDPLAYTFASVALDASGGTNDDEKADLLPNGGTVALLGVSARTISGKPATVTLTPSNGATNGEALTLDGTLLVANAGVLAALVNGGPRSLTLVNTEAEAVTIDLLTAVDSGQP